MKRVLQVVSCLEMGGTEAYIMNNYRAVDRERLQFDFIVFNKKEYPYIDEIKAMGGRVFFAIPPSKNQIARFERLIIKLIKENGPYEAIHSHVNRDNAWVMRAAKKAGVPRRISHAHSVAPVPKSIFKKLYSSFKKRILNKYSTIKLACSEEAAVAIYGKNEDKVEVLKNGINVEQFINVSNGDVERIKEELNINPNVDLVMGNISRFDQQKNPIFAVEVFSNIAKIKENAILVLGGVDGGLKDSVEKRVEELNIKDKVRILGVRKDVATCLKLLDIFLFPVYPEGFGIALLEAQASGCRCFTSTGVTRKTDMGLGLVSYTELDKGTESWAQLILDEAKGLKRPDGNMIRKAFFDAGYSIEASVNRLKAIYCE